MSGMEVLDLTSKRPIDDESSMTKCKVLDQKKGLVVIFYVFLNLEQANGANKIGETATFAINLK